MSEDPLSFPLCSVVSQPVPADQPPDGEEELEEEEGPALVCPSVYTALLEQVTRIFCISLLG